MLLRLLLNFHHGLFKALSEADTLSTVSLILDQELVDLGQLDRTFDLIDLQIAPVDLTVHFSNSSFIAADELLSLVVLLLIREAGIVSYE